MNNDALFVEATHPAHQIQTWHWLFYWFTYIPDISHGVTNWRRNKI